MVILLKVTRLKPQMGLVVSANEGWVCGRKIFEDLLMPSDILKGPAETVSDK